MDVNVCAAGERCVDGTVSVIIGNHTQYDDLILCFIMLHRVHSDDLYFNK